MTLPEPLGIVILVATLALAVGWMLDKEAWR